MKSLTCIFAVALCTVTSVLTLSSLAVADDPPATPAEPKPLMGVPLGAVPGQTIAMKVRGLRLDGATEVRSNTEGITVKFLSASKAAAPANVSPERAGDSQVAFELTLAENYPQPASDVAELQFITPSGQATYRLPVAAAKHSALEVEPNPGYQQAQKIELSQVILGQIERPQDVDVYAVELAEGQRVRISVAAQEYGSALDPLLTLVDAHGVLLASSDDRSGSRDCQVEQQISASGRYLVVVQDANDLGGEAQPYRLSLATVPPPVSFVRQIAPILQQRCVACHGPRKAEGGYRVDTFTAALAAGDSGMHGFAPHAVLESESYRRITSEDAAERMPLSGEPLSSEQTALIKRWIEAGSRFDGEAPDATLLSQIPPLTHPEAPEHYAGALPITAMAYASDGKELLVGGYHEVTVWDPVGGTLLRRIGNVAERTYQIAVHPTGDQFAVACGNPGQWGEVRIFHTSGQLQKVLMASPDVVLDVAYSPSGDRLAVAGSDATIRLYDVPAGQLQRTISSHLDWVLSVAWSQDGSKLASASRDKTAKVFSAETGELLATYTRHDAAVRGVMFHPTGEEVYSAAHQRWERWMIAEAKHVRDMHLGGEVHKILGFGNFFAVPSTNGRIHLMKAAEAERIREFHGSDQERFLSVAAHEPTDRLAAGSHRGGITVWELSTGKKVVEFSGFPAVPARSQ